MFRKVLFMWSSMPIFSFVGYTLTELFRKPDNWRQIYKQTSSTLYTSNNMSRWKKYLYVIARLRNSCLFTFLKKKEKKGRSSHMRCRSSHRRCSVCFFLPASFLKKRFQHKSFPVKFAKLLRTPILKTSANDCFWTCSIKRCS